MLIFYLSLRRNSDNNKLKITGGHDVDRQWLKDVRAASSFFHDKRKEQIDVDGKGEILTKIDVKRPLYIVPRIVLETVINYPTTPAEANPKSIKKLKSDAAEIVKLLNELKTKFNFDGFTFDISLQHYPIILSVLK